jgi:hypothetical protein
MSKVTAIPPRPTREGTVPGAEFRTMDAIIRDTDILNAAIRRADQHRGTMRTPTTRRYEEQPRLMAVL